jgi:hypothetical protein
VFFSYAGVFFFLPCIDKYDIVDLRTVSFDVPPQEVRDLGRVAYNFSSIIIYVGKGGRENGGEEFESGTLKMSSFIQINPVFVYLLI